MKISTDPRHLKRREVVSELFSEIFTSQAKISETAKKIMSKKDQLDEKIIAAAPAWPITKLNKIDLAILRLAVYELMYENNVPSKVAIDEAVELAKEFGAENSAGFVNGVLGTVYQDLKKDETYKK